MLRGTIVNHTYMHAGWSKKSQMLNLFHFRMCLQQIWKMGAFHVQQHNDEKGLFLQFRDRRYQDNGKSLSTFVMQLSAPLHALHKRLKCESFIFLFTHHSYIQIVLVNGNFDDYRVKML